MPDPTREELAVILDRCEKTNGSCPGCLILHNHSCPDIVRALLSAFEREERMLAVVRLAIDGHPECEWMPQMAELYADAAIKAAEEGR